jgi:hypothetical protein
MIGKPTQQRVWARVVVLALLAAAMVVLSACGDPADFANPFDASNLLTAGSPPNVSVRPGDGRATLSWYPLGVQGIREYRVYRRFDGDPGSDFALVGRVPATQTDRATPIVFVDDDNGRGLLNDQEDFNGRPVPYVYRITVVDVDGVETPNPSAPPAPDEKPLRVWPTSRVTPSDAAPPPKVVVTVADLLVALSWATYDPPGDVVAYRVYGKLVTDEAHPALVLLQEIPVQAAVIGPPGQVAEGATREYFDRDFARDLMTKEYLVTAVDKFGVESEDRPEWRRRGQTPNLPPRPVRWQITDVTTAGSGLLQVSLRWTQAPERDVAGYNIYGRAAEGWRLRKTVRNPTDTSAVLIEFSPEVLFLGNDFYFVTAFDNTNKENGDFDQVPPP